MKNNNLLNNKMSILNHFGKVKSKYEPYKNTYAFGEGFVCNDGNYIGLIYDYTNPSGIFTEYKVVISKYAIHSNHLKSDSIHILYCHKYITNNAIEFVKQTSEIPSLLEGNSGGRVRESFGLNLETECSVSNIIERFQEEITRVSNIFSHYVWKIGKICPLLTIIDLIILKISECDNHTQHIEKNIIQLIEDNKLLQTKINSLEQQMSLLNKKINTPYAEVVSIAEAVLKL